MRFVGLLAAVTLLAAPSRADHAGGGRGEDTVPVDVHSEDPSIRHSIRTREGVTFASCVGKCTMFVPPGDYVFESSETETLRAGKSELSVRGYTAVDVLPASKTVRAGGVTLGVLGLVAAAVGGSLFYEEWNKEVSCERDCSSPSYGPSIATIVGGVVVSTVGWVMFGRASTEVRVQDSARVPVSFAALPLPGGASAALTWAF